MEISVAFFIKVIACIFFGYVSIDSFRKIGIIQKDINDDLLNPKTGRILQNNSRRNGVVFAILCVVAFVSIFTRIAPLGE